MQPRVLFLRRFLIPLALSVTLLFAVLSLGEVLFYIYERRSVPPFRLLLEASF